MNFLIVLLVTTITLMSFPITLLNTSITTLHGFAMQLFTSVRPRGLILKFNGGIMGGTTRFKLVNIGWPIYLFVTIPVTTKKDPNQGYNHELWR